jgi:hypothetical protein
MLFIMAVPAKRHKVAGVVIQSIVVNVVYGKLCLTEVPERGVHCFLATLLARVFSIFFVYLIEGISHSVMFRTFRFSPFTATYVART